MMNGMIPSLFLDFVNAQLDSRVVLVRGGNTATRVNSNGFIEVIDANLPRFDYDPVTRNCLGLLIEQASTNSALYSSDFSNARYGKVGGSYSLTQNKLAPDNTISAWTIEDTSSVAVVYLNYDPQVTLATGALSIFIEKTQGALLSYPFLSFRDNTGQGQGVVINTSTGVVSDLVGAAFPGSFFGSGGAARTRVIDHDSFWRIILDTSGRANVRTMQFGPAINQNGGTGSQVAAVGAHVFWGLQYEVGNTGTSYIPTTVAATTRNADAATITGTDFSDWWQASKGGVLVRARPGTISGTRPWLQFDDGTANEIIALRGNTTNPELYIVDGGVAQAQIDAGTIVANTDYSLIGWWATNDCKARLDSGAVVTDTSATIPTVTQARLGSDGTNYLNGHLASISYYDNQTGQIYTRRKNKAVFQLF